MAAPGADSSADAAASVVAQAYEDRFPCMGDRVPDEFRRIAPRQLLRGDLAFTYVPLYDPKVPEIAANNTLFEALSVHRFESPVFHMDVRNLVAVWMLGCMEWTREALRKYRDESKEVTHREAVKYVCDVRNGNAPGTPVEMAAAAMAFEAHIPVYKKRGPDADGSDAQIVLDFAIWPCYRVPEMDKLNVWPLAIFAEDDVYGALKIKGKAKAGMRERMKLPPEPEDPDDEDEDELPGATVPPDDAAADADADAELAEEEPRGQAAAPVLVLAGLQQIEALHGQHAVPLGQQQAHSWRRGHRACHPQPLEEGRRE